MKFTETILKGSFIVEPDLKGDARGWFMRAFCKDVFKEIGHVKEWVQMNHSFTKEKGSIRGMHYQLPPFSETKLVRCIAGAVYDVIIDLRNGSNTFLNWYGLELSAANKKMIYVPDGFAHGFQCLTEDCELLYSHSQFYAQGSERGIRYNDKMIGINWPLPETNISTRDQQHELLSTDFSGIKLS